MRLRKEGLALRCWAGWGGFFGTWQTLDDQWMKSNRTSHCSTCCIWYFPFKQAADFIFRLGKRFCCVEQLSVYSSGLCVQCVCTAPMYRLLESIKMYVLPFISSKSVFCFDSYYFITYLCLKWRKTYFNFQRNLHFTFCLSSISCFNANIITTVNYCCYFVVNVKLGRSYSLCCTLSVLQCLSIIVFS